MRYADRRQAGRMIAKVLLDRHYGCLMIVQALPAGRCTRGIRGGEGLRSTLGCASRA